MSHTKHIPMLDLRAEYEYMKADIDAAIARCLEHQRWILGPEVAELEHAIEEYLGVNHCIGISSGTDALVLSLRALAIKTKGQEYFDRTDLIITTPFTFTATGDAILRAGATPLFVDIEPSTYNIDPALIRACLSLGAEPIVFSPSRVVGILPVHLYGRSCEMDEIISIAEEFSLFVVEDCAQAFGAAWGGKKLGTMGDVGAFSFFPSKNLGAFGDAGMVSTNDDEIGDLTRMLIKHGGKDKYNVDHIGYNARMDTLQAAVLLAKLSYLDEFNAYRRHIAETYTAGLKDVPGITLPFAFSPSPIAGFEHVFHQFSLRVRDGQRDVLQKHLREAGIDSMVYYPVPLHKMKVFEDRTTIWGELTHGETAVNEVLSLPSEPLQSEEVTLHIVEAIKSFFT